jgi:hypothetical protein
LGIPLSAAFAMRVLIAVSSFGFAIAATPNVAYFRNHNMDRSSPLSVSEDATSVTLNEWDTTLNLFDSTQDVTVQRIDMTGPASSTVTLYSKASPLVLAEGPIYFFHNSTNLTMTDPSGMTYTALKTDAVVWLSKGACVELSVSLSDAGEASLVAVTSGKVQWRPSASTSASCGTTTVLVGAGLQVGGGGGGSGGGPWIYNQIPYTLTDPDTCETPLSHGYSGYSQTDEPIRPLDPHFHTRGALYYTQYGSSKYNDEAAPNDTLYQGELRFVNTGVYYGPEEMDTSTCFVASVHEADPAAVDPVGKSVSSECPFACMNKLNGRTPSTCTRSSARASEILFN